MFTWCLKYDVIYVIIYGMMTVVEIFRHERLDDRSTPQV